MKTELVKLSEVKNNPNNPRTLKDDKFHKLVKSIKEFPEMLEIRQIVVNDDMIVLGGNMRLKACKEAGLKEVYIIKASNLTEEQQKQFIIKDNVGFGEWDWDMLANEWNAEELEEWGLDVPSFETGESEQKEHKDLSSTIENLYRIEIICNDEEEQENSYNKLIEQGYECRLLTL
jgi:ParB-like chromosome segregation protein Spo0J